jgi:hypothetical protein
MLAKAGKPEDSESGLFKIKLVARAGIYHEPVLAVASFRMRSGRKTLLSSRLDEPALEAASARI